MIAFHMLCASTDAQAEAAAREPINAYMRSLVDANGDWGKGMTSTDYPNHPKMIENLRKVNAQLAKLVEYLGASEAPQVIEFYLRHNSSYYANKGHDLGLLLIDYQKLRTEWITGRQITTAQARSDEAKQHNVQVVQDWLKKKMAGEEGSG